jgi:hypothetical protein
MYGAEGQRKDYAPYGCHSIINFKVGSGEHHGCPFRYFGNDELRGFLTRNYGLSAEDAMQVVQKNDGKHHEVIVKGYCRWHVSLCSGRYIMIPGRSFRRLLYPRSVVTQISITTLRGNIMRS